jgi:hypothetical protein
MEQPKMKKLLSLQEYAAREGIQYETAWKRWKGGRVRGRKLSGGRVAVFSRQPLPVLRGQPPKWSEEKVLREVSRLCRDRYLKPSDFPPYLYKLCRRFCGSVRAAKWKADILRGRRWTHGKFLREVNRYCRKRYREDRDWPEHLRALAKRFCGSTRRAKWEAGVIDCRRRSLRGARRFSQKRWTRKKFLGWVRDFCSAGYRKQQAWPGYMRTLAKTYFGSVRAAKVRAGIIRRPRRRPV